MDAVSDLKFFVTLARHGTLTRAAQEFGVTPPTVSKRLASLEQRLGVRLMNRSTRRISLTPEGETYLGQGERIMEELDALEQTVAGGGGTPRGLLRVHATLGFGRRHIAPAISHFLRQYPDIDVQLHLSHSPVNLADSGFDVILRFGDAPDSRLTARTLAYNRRLLCASPAYLRAAGEPATPADLQTHQCIVIRESDETYGSWNLSQGSRSQTIKVEGRVSSNDGETAVEWALNGQGIILRSEWDVARYLRSGRLRRVLPAWSLPPADVVAVYPTRRYLSVRTRAFLDTLMDWFADQRKPAPGTGSHW